MFFKISIGAIFSFLLLYLVFSDIDLNAVQKGLLYTDTTDVFIAISALVFFYTLRAYRWKILLGKNISYSDAFFASSLAYFFNLILVFQAGEFSKVHFLKKKYNIDRGFTVSTILIERMLDASALVIFFFISLVYYSKSSTYMIYLLGILGLVSLILLTFSKYFFSKARGTYMHNKVHGLLLKRKLGVYLIELYKSLNSAFLLLHNNGLRMVIYTLILWIVNYLSVFVFLGKYGNFFEIIGGYAILSLGVAAQFTPANIGQYELLWAEVFKGVVNIPVEQLIASGIILHSIIILTISLFALVSWAYVRKR